MERNMIGNEGREKEDTRGFGDACKGGRKRRRWWCGRLRSRPTCLMLYESQCSPFPAPSSPWLPFSRICYTASIRQHRFKFQNGDTPLNKWAQLPPQTGPIQKKLLCWPKLPILTTHHKLFVPKTNNKKTPNRTKTKLLILSRTAFGGTRVYFLLGKPFHYFILILNIFYGGIKAWM